MLERWQGGVRLQQVRALPRRRSLLASGAENVVWQVAAQDLAFGIKFSATATLDIEELPEGIPAAGAAPPQAAKRFAPPACGAAAGCDPVLCLIPQAWRSSSTSDASLHGAAAQERA